MFKAVHKFYIVISIINIVLCSKNPLKLQLKDYQELNYNDFSFEKLNNNRLKREEPVENVILETNRLSFTAYNRTFNIFLKRNTNLVSDNIQIEVRYSNLGEKNRIEYEDNHFKKNYFIGFVENEPESSVLCYFESLPFNTTSKPLIYVQIRIVNNKTADYYYIEPIFHDKKTSYVVYRNQDVESDILSNGIFNSSVCRPKHLNNTESYEDENDLKKNSKRQATSQNVPLKKKTRCSLALVADHRFYTEIGNSNIKQTTAYLVSVIGAVNNIFTATKWRLDKTDDENGDDSGSGIDGNDLLENTGFGFKINKIIILTNPEKNVMNHYNREDSSKDSDNILELFGQNEDWTSYCLAHLFTYQEFQNSVLGLAYVASPLKSTLGGICSRALTARAQKFSVNTGLSSYKSTNFMQKRLTSREAELVTAHEFGHNWGSEHDPLNELCTPSAGTGGGNYLMYTYLNSGHDRNNIYFSPCSINGISEVLKSKTECFSQEELKFCGNERIDDQEECDEGENGGKCCTSNCKLKPGFECSDSNHECCENCKIAKSNRQCFSNPNYLECFEGHSYCDGINKKCPDTKPKPKNSECSSFDMGKCDATGHCNSICQQKNINYASCLCTNKIEKCMICCRLGLDNATDVCKPYHVLFGEISPRFMSKGRACHDGLCNEKNVCVNKVRDYVSRFWKVIQTATVSSFVDFMKRNIVASIILISLIIWVPISCCIHFCVDKGQRAEQLQKLRSKISEIRDQSNSLDETVKLNGEEE